MASPVELFRRLTNGVYVVTASHGDERDGFTAAWLTQASFEPLLVALSVNPANATWTLIDRSGRFAVNVLASGQLEAARHFGLQSGRERDKLAGVPIVRRSDGAVVLADGVAWLDCRVQQRVPAGDHVVVIAQVVGGELVNPDAVPLHYAETGEMDGSRALYPPRFTGA
jgi:flavin reductase (DIM6/NTAB) family NADH-FMN oxidoreductase RutF